MNGTTSAGPSQPLHTVLVLDGSTYCGVHAHVCSLAQGLVARGVDVTVCAPVAAEEAYGFAKTGARFRTLEIGRHASGREEVAALAVLRYVCSSASVVHAHGLRAGVLSALALRATGVGRHRAPLVVTLHGVYAACVRPRPWLLSLVERRLVRAADIVLGASSDVVAYARYLGAKDARLAPVAAPKPAVPLDTEHVRRKMRSRLGVGERPLLVSVGSLFPDGGSELLLDAARVWRCLDPQPLLVIAGEGSQRPVLQDRIDTEDLPVCLLGACDEVPELIAASDAVVLPSRWEGRALIAQEALRSGTPLVAMAIGGVPELVGDAAELVPYGDAEALGRAVADLLADPVRCAVLAEQGRAQAASWPDEDETVAQVLSIYDELAQRSGW